MSVPAPPAPVDQRPSEESGLKRVLGPRLLLLFIVGDILGAGIYAVTGEMALEVGGIVWVPFLVAFAVATLTAYSYLELVTKHPQAAGAALYAHKAFGLHFVTFLVAFAVVCSGVTSASTSANLLSVNLLAGLEGVGIDVPQGRFTITVVALGFMLLLAAVNLRGVNESVKFNVVLTLVEMLALAIVIAIGFTVIGRGEGNLDRLVVFDSGSDRGLFLAVTVATAIAFFAMVGFEDSVNMAEETKDPQRDMPFGIIASLVVCTVLYILVALVLTGMLPWRELNTAEPLATAFSALGMNWTAGIIALGAVIATTSVLVVFQLGQPRIFFTMARDGLLPPWAAKVHPKYQTPHVTTIITGLAVGLVSGVANIGEIVELTNIGTLFAFILVALGIIILRHSSPDQPRPFRTPWVPVVPLLAIASCAYLMLQLPTVTWIRFGVWLGVGLLFYYLYGYRHSRLHVARPAPEG